MAVPKKRTPSSRRDRRRANIYIKEPQLVTCKKCGKPSLPHIVCPECGFYKGKEYVNVMAKIEKKQKVEEVKEEVIKEEKKIKKAKRQKKTEETSK